MWNGTCSYDPYTTVTNHILIHSNPLYPLYSNLPLSNHGRPLHPDLPLVSPIYHSNPSYTIIVTHHSRSIVTNFPLNTSPPPLKLWGAIKYAKLLIKILKQLDYVKKLMKMQCQWFAASYQWLPLRPAWTIDIITLRKFPSSFASQPPGCFHSLLFHHSLLWPGSCCSTLSPVDDQFQRRTDFLRTFGRNQ